MQLYPTFQSHFFSFSILNSSLYLLRAEKVKFISKSIVLVISSGDLVVTNNECFDYFYMFFFQLVFKTKKKSVMVKKYSTFKLQHNQIGWWDAKDKNIFYHPKTKLKSHWFNPIGTIAFGGKIILTMSLIKNCALSFFFTISTVQETDIPCSLYFHKGTKLLEFQ